MTNEAELLPCPFCGSKAELADMELDFVHCSNDDCDLRDAEIIYSFWNTRATLDAKNDGFDYMRVRKWMLDKERKPANLSFTAGAERNAAYLIEEYRAALDTSDYDGCMADLQDLIRVARDNPAGLQDYLKCNYPEEMGLSKEEHRAYLDVKLEPLTGTLPSSVKIYPSDSNAQNGDWQITKMKVGSVEYTHDDVMRLVEAAIKAWRVMDIESPNADETDNLMEALAPFTQQISGA